MLHSHHILPRHAGGTDDPSNLYPLTPTQHALAHRNRAILEVSWKDWIAWKMLSGQIPAQEATLEAIRTAQRKRRGIPHSAEHNRNMGLALRGRKQPWTAEMNRRPDIRAKRQASMIGNKNGVGGPGSRGKTWSVVRASCIRCRGLFTAAQLSGVHKFCFGSTENILS